MNTSFILPTKITISQIIFLQKKIFKKNKEMSSDIGGLTKADPNKLKRLLVELKYSV
jgi:hypothetical protein